MPNRKVWFSWLLVADIIASTGGITGQPISVQFTDITEKAGITFKHVSSPEKKYIVESMSGGVALLDYDNDGYLDIYLVNSLTADMVKLKSKNPECSISQQR